MAVDGFASVTLRPLFTQEFLMATDGFASVTLHPYFLPVRSLPSQCSGVYHGS